MNKPELISAFAAVLFQRMDSNGLAECESVAVELTKVLDDNGYVSLPAIGSQWTTELGPRPAGPVSVVGYQIVASDLTAYTPEVFAVRFQPYSPDSELKKQVDEALKQGATADEVIQIVLGSKASNNRVEVVSAMARR